MLYQSYKNRSIDFNKQVKIYKNLHNGLFSVIQNNLVVAHIESFTLNNVVFKVNESGRQRVIKEKKKNVHAFICGLLVNVNEDLTDVLVSNPHTLIRYNPHHAKTFLLGVNDFPIQQSDTLLVGTSYGVALAYAY